MGKLKDKIKKFDEFYNKHKYELILDTYDDTKNNKVNCSKCGHKLGIFRMLRKAVKVERGKFYFVRCNNCNYLNKIKRSLKK